MGKKVSTNISIDAETKVQAQEICETLGLDLSTAVNIFLHKLVMQRAIPFIIEDTTPSESMREALKELEEYNRHPEKYKRYSTFREALDEVLNDA